MLRWYLKYALMHFFGWQAAVFFATAVVVSRRAAVARGRPARRKPGAFQRGVAGVLSRRRAGCEVRVVCAVDGLCGGERAAGDRACGGRAIRNVGRRSRRRLHAVLVPICFFLGVLHAITVPIVAALAVAAALPGAVFWMRRLAKWTYCSLVPAKNMKTREPWQGQWTVFRWCLLEVIWVVLAIQFIMASTHEAYTDSVRVHLPYMLRVIADHGLSHQYACWHRLQPMAAQTYCATIACRRNGRGGKVVLLVRSGGAGVAGGRGGSTPQRIAGNWLVRRRGGP